MAIKIQPLTEDDQEVAEDSDDKRRLVQEKYDLKRRPYIGIKKTFAIMVDGEGNTPEGSNVHRYTELRAGSADGNFVRSIVDPEGLSTLKCFNFIYNLPQAAIKVGFAFNYDVNMMLGDLPKRNLLMLHLNQTVKWKGWVICWTPHKSFSLSRQDDRSHGASVVWDMFSYFQGSFVKTIEKWNIGDDEGRNFIKVMKKQRSHFVNVDPATIAKYCDLECKYGAEVFQKVLDYTRSIGLKLQRYDGAGSVAAAMLKKHSIKDYMYHQINRLPDEVVLSGYDGGRFDITAFGLCGNAFERDINSAYPYQALHLPCLSCGAWRYSPEYDERAPWAIWNASWNIDKSSLWSPFPYRHSRGIYYLRNGSGWYWQNEVREAVALYPTSVQVHGGYIYEVNCDHQPFDFVQYYYDYRQQLVKKGNLAELLVKLGLNSLYGKLAQNVGHRGKVPSTQCYVWAGIITSNTRAMLLSSIRDDPDSALLVATDAVVRTKEIDGVRDDPGLGGWKTTALPDLFIVGNGVYQSRAKAQSGHWVTVKEKTRGYSPNFMREYDDNDRLKVDHWVNLRNLAAQSDCFDYKQIQRTDFIALGNSVRDDFAHFDDWRKWITKPHPIYYGNFKDSLKQLRDGRLYPGDNPWGDLPSQPFCPKNYRYDEGVPVVDRG